MLVLWQAICNIVVIPFIRHMNMHAKLNAGRPIKCAHGDGYLVPIDGIPKEKRTAGGTEAALHLFRRAEPGKFIGTVDRQGCP